MLERGRRLSSERNPLRRRALDRGGNYRCAVYLPGSLIILFPVEKEG